MVVVRNARLIEQIDGLVLNRLLLGGCIPIPIPIPGDILELVGVGGVRAVGITQDSPTILVGIQATFVHY